MLNIYEYIYYIHNIYKYIITYIYNLPILEKEKNEVEK